jgi:catechol 2,3-dioxygenase-like lactoylglutathione lyase family enzyme
MRSSAIRFEGIDHVQLAAPHGCTAEGRRFFGELLGLAEIPRPPDLAAREGLWFQCGAQQIHVGVETDFRPAKKAHPALRLSDGTALDALRDVLIEAGVTVKNDPAKVPGVSRFFIDDPWGNRLELVAS